MNRRFIATLAIAALLAVAGSVAVAVADDDDDDEGFSARLKGFREVPAVSTVASGHFEAAIDEGAGSISYTLQYSGLEGTVSGAHIHLGQKGVAGAVIAFLCGGGGKPPCPASGTVTGTIAAANIGAGAEAQGITTGEFAETVKAIKAGVVYANVHSSKFPGGEIRGQVDDD